MSGSLIEKLRDDARRADELREQARRLLVDSARAGASAGYTQRQIADAMGRSQPEISRLLRFHGTTAHARALERNRAAILALLSRVDARNVRVFGSVSRGEDGRDSDVDLLVDFRTAPSLLELAAVEAELAELVGTHVDIVPAASLRSNLSERVLGEAVPL